MFLVSGVSLGLIVLGWISGKLASYDAEALIFLSCWGLQMWSPFG